MYVVSSHEKGLGTKRKRLMPVSLLSIKYAVSFGKELGGLVSAFISSNDEINSTSLSKKFGLGVRKTNLGTQKNSYHHFEDF